MIDRVFITLLYIYACASSCNLTFGGDIVRYIMWPAMVMGCILIVYRVVKYKEYKKMPALFATIGMLASISLSTIINRQYNLKENILYCAYWFIYFIVLYNVKSGTTIDKVKKDFEYLGILILVSINLSVIIGFVQMADGYSRYLAHPESGFGYWQGFAIGRLWGLYLNPNRGAISIALAVAIVLYFIVKFKSRVVKAIGIIDIVAMNVYIALSDSRSGAVSFGVLLGIYVFFLLLCRLKDKEKCRAVNIIGVIIISTVLMVCGYIVPRQTKDGHNFIINKIVEYRVSNMDPDNMSEEEIKEQLQIQNLEIERGYDLSTNVSNNRFVIWESGLEIFSDSPKNIIIGTSFGGFTPYAEQNLPKTAIVSSFGFSYKTLENDIINLMVSQGVFGLAMLIWFLVCVFKTLVKNIFKVKKEYRNMVFAMLALVFSYASSALFGSAMFYQFSNNTVVFWVILGYLMYILKQSGEEYED